MHMKGSEILRIFSSTNIHAAVDDFIGKHTFDNNDYNNDNIF